METMIDRRTLTIAGIATLGSSVAPASSVNSYAVPPAIGAVAIGLIRAIAMSQAKKYFKKTVLGMARKRLVKRPLGSSVSSSFRSTAAENMIDFIEFSDSLYSKLELSHDIIHLLERFKDQHPNSVAPTIWKSQAVNDYIVDFENFTDKIIETNVDIFCYGQNDWKELMHKLEPVSLKILPRGKFRLPLSENMLPDKLVGKNMKIRAVIKDDAPVEVKVDPTPIIVAK